MNKERAKLHGRVHVFGNDINTDYIIAGKYKFKTNDMRELARHAFEDIDPEFIARVQPGDIVVAGNNFGCGSSREQAPLVLLHAGISAVVAASFARIFFRNAINTGLPVLQCPVEGLQNGDQLSVDLATGEIMAGDGRKWQANPLPPVMLQILQNGGLVPHIKKHGGFGFVGGAAD
jgi:3-isopropylmalate/(R)-2-methylmalate dehydratase small subunit